MPQIVTQSRLFSVLNWLAALVLAVAAPGLAAAQQPLIVETLTISTPGGTARGFLASIYLQDPSVELMVTGPLQAGAAGDSVLTTTPAFRTATGARLAINANFFSTLTSPAADAVGLVVSNGTLVSPVRTFNGAPDPAIIFDRWRTGRIGNIGSTALAGVQNAVAGVGPSTTDPDPGTLLVTDGVNTGATARVDPAVRNPRTAIGLNRTGTTLFILVIDGRQTNWSVGMTLPEVADQLIARGCYRAINLDGGGSTSFVYQATAGGGLTQNRPSDGSFRAVSTNLGIRINSGGTAAAPTFPDRINRPIRGAWLRPPNPISSLESIVLQLANAGITDLYLETLYWGRDTGLTGVMPSRFGFDYLGQAITIAAKYGMRVHAWCETGYLDYGTNPSALLAANPGFVVKHRDSSNTSTGDIANQRFVNLGHPGVRTLLNNYFTALGASYPGLETIQADYHFFPLAASGVAPWSFDNWATAAYQAQYGVNPTTEVGGGGASPSARWLTWNRDNITEALRQFREAVRTTAPSTPFSAVAFSDWSGTFHRSKMIDLPSWAKFSGTDHFFMMAYFAATSSITSDLALAQTAVPGRRIIAGLANLTSGTRPTITEQLTASKVRGIEDFAWFEANTFISNPAMLTMLRNWINTSATPQRGDINRDGFIDARDLALMTALLATANPPGSPIAVTPGTTRYDLDGSNFIDAADNILLIAEFRRYKFGDDGTVDSRDLARLVACYTGGNPFNAAPASPPAPATLLHLWDLSGDGVVNYDDQLILHAAMTTPTTPDADCNVDGRVDIEDVYIQSRGIIVGAATSLIRPRDANRDGTITGADGITVANVARANDFAMRGSQR